MPFSSADPAAFFALGMQSGLGTPQTTLAKLRFAKYLSGTDARPEIDVTDLREGGDGLDFGFSYKTRQRGVGQLVANLRGEIAGQFLALLPGAATWDGGSAPAIHTFHTGHASHPWGTILAGHPATSLVHLIRDVRFTGYRIEAESGNPWRLSAPFVAIFHGASLAAPAPTYHDGGEAPVLFYNTPTYAIDGTVDTDITGFNLDVGLGVEELQSQDVNLDEIVVQNRDSNLEITRRYEDAVLWKKIYMSGGVQPSHNVATGSFEGQVSYGTGASKRRMRVFCPLISYRGDVLTELDPDGRTIVETIAAKCLKAGTHAVIQTVDNAHASAYIS